MSAFVKLSYVDYVAIRELMSEINGNEDPDDGLSPAESGVLMKVSQIIANMEQMRRDDQAGVVRRGMAR